MLRAWSNSSAASLANLAVQFRCEQSFSLRQLLAADIETYRDVWRETRRSAFITVILMLGISAAARVEWERAKQFAAGAPQVVAEETALASIPWEARLSRLDGRAGELAAVQQRQWHSELLLRLVKDAPQMAGSDLATE